MQISIRQDFETLKKIAVKIVYCLKKRLLNKATKPTKQADK